MLPLALILLGGLGAGVLIGGLSGCGGSTLPPREPEPPPKDPPNPPLDFAEKDNPLAYWTFKKLVEGGTSPRLMDQGFTRPSFLASKCSSGPKPCIEGAANGKLSAEEILDFAFSDLMNYSTSIENVLGKPLSLNLNDYNADTKFDDGIREKVKDAILRLERILHGQGLAKEKPEYQEKMAVGLFYLVAMPDIRRIKKNQELFENLTKELDGLGLGDFKKYLTEEGGIRIVENNFDVELSALQALEQGKGKSFEHSKVLYSVMRMANLNPSFAYVNSYKSKNPVLGVARELHPNLEHICLALQFGDKTRLFDSYLATTQPEHEEYVLMGPRQFIALEYLNHGKLAAQRGDNEKVVRAWEMSEQLDPNSPFLALNKGIILFMTDKKDDALKQLDRSLSLYPNQPFAHFTRGNIRGAKGDMKGAEEDFTASYEKGQMSSALLNRALLKAQDKNIEGAQEDFSELIKINPAEGYFNRAVFFARLNEPDKALADLNKLLEINPDMAQAYGTRGAIWAAKGDAQKATSDFLELIRRAPLDGSLQIAMEGLAPLLIRKWEDPKRKKDFEQLGKETGLNAAKVEAWIIVTGLVWKSGQKEAAIRGMGVLAEELKKVQEALAKEKKAIPDFSKNILRQLLSDLPKEMRKSLEVKALLGALSS